MWPRCGWPEANIAAFHESLKGSRRQNPADDLREQDHQTAQRTNIRSTFSVGSRCARTGEASQETRETTVSSYNGGAEESMLKTLIWAFFISKVMCKYNWLWFTNTKKHWRK